MHNILVNAAVVNTLKFTPTLPVYMPRLVRGGGEPGRSGAVATNGEGQGFFTSGTVTADTEKQFDGSCCMKCGKSGANYVGIENNATNIVSTLGRSYWFQAAIRLSSISPSTNLALMKIFGAANNELFLTTGEEIALWNNTKSQVEITSTFTPEAEKTYLYTIKETVNAAGKGVLALTIRDEKGEVKYESGDKEVEIGNTKITFWQAGHHEAGESGVDVWVSAVRLNDSTGEKEKADPGFRKLVMLKPVSDNSREGMVTGAGGTTKLYDANDNFPPVGVANGSKTATSQIYSATSSTTHYFRANTATYEAAVAEGGGGLISADTIKAMLVLARISNSTTTTRSMGVKCNANPEIGEATASTIATATGTDPTGWKTITTGHVYDQTPTRSSGAQPQIRKNAATTNATACDMLGVYVDFLPGEEESGETFTESAEGTIGVEGAFSETLEASETISGTENVTGSVSEAVEMSDSQSGSRLPTGSFTESLEYPETASGEVTVEGAGTESLVFTETASGTQAPTGSFTETVLFEESAEGYEPMIGVKEETFETEEEPTEKPPYMQHALGRHHRIVEEPSEEELSLFGKLMAFFKGES